MSKKTMHRTQIYLTPEQYKGLKLAIRGSKRKILSLSEAIRLAVDDFLTKPASGE